MRIIGCDPGLASFGLAVAVLEERVRVERVEVLRTEASARARRIRKADDNSDRARELARALNDVLRDGDVVAICVEAVALPFGRVQHSVVSNLGRVRGLLDALAEVYEVPIIEETPQALKRLITGRGDASKEEVRRALEGRFPELARMWPTQKTLHEHAGDAVATIVAGLQSDVVRAARRAAGVAA